MSFVLIADPTKYFGCELGAQTQFDIKHDRYIVNGSHSSEKLQELLDGFIRKFVLCPECDNPETVYSVHAKSGIIYNSCQACGYAGKPMPVLMLAGPPHGGMESHSVEAEMWCCWKIKTTLQN